MRFVATALNAQPGPVGQGQPRGNPLPVPRAYGRVCASSALRSNAAPHRTNWPAYPAQYQEADQTTPTAPTTTTTNNRQHRQKGTRNRQQAPDDTHQTTDTRRPNQQRDTNTTKLTKQHTRQKQTEQQTHKGRAQNKPPQNHPSITHSPPSGSALSCPTRPSSTPALSALLIQRPKGAGDHSCRRKWPVPTERAPPPAR